MFACRHVHKMFGDIFICFFSIQTRQTNVWIFDNHQIGRCDGVTDKTPFRSIWEGGLDEGKGKITFWISDGLDCRGLDVKLAGHFQLLQVHFEKTKYVKKKTCFLLTCL